MINSPYFDRIENYVSQVGRLFCAADTAGVTGVPLTKVWMVLRYMVAEGMIVPLKKAERTQYYRYNEKFDYPAWRAAQKRIEGRRIMRENSDLFHRMLSEVGYG